jgi:hypothetical protein
MSQSIEKHPSRVGFDEFDQFDELDEFDQLSSQ